MNKGYMLIIASGILYGTITPGAQLLLDMGFSLMDVSFYRAFFITIMLLPVIFIIPKYMLTLKTLPFFIVYGLIGGLLEASMFASLYLGVPVAIVVFLLYTQPVWTILMGRIMLDEKITRRHIHAVITGVAGMLVLATSWEITSVKSLAGLIIALLSGILLALWIIYGRKSAIYKNHYITTTFGWSLFASLWLLLFVIIIKWQLPQFGEYLSISPGLVQTNLPEIILFALIAGILPHLLFYKGVGTVSAASAGIILLLEPVSASLIAYMIFSQSLGYSFFAGAFLILMSNYFVLARY